MKKIDYKQVREIEKNLGCSTYEATDIYLKMEKNDIIDKSLTKISKSLAGIQTDLNNVFYSKPNKTNDRGILAKIALEIKNIGGVIEHY